MRPCYALSYDTPNHYEQKYRDGELEKRETFRNRILTDTPKFVQKKLSTSVNENEGFCSDLSTYSKEDENKCFDLSTLVNEALKK